MKIKETITSIGSALKENSVKGRLYRFLFFILVYAAGRYVGNFLEANGVFNWLHNPFLWFIDTVTIWFLGFFYDTITSTADHLVAIGDNYCIHLFPGCSGLQPLLRLTLILLLYPIPWKIKSWLFPVSWAIIIMAATIHFILLVPISYHYPEYYNFSHNWLTRIIFYGIYFLTWLLWERVGYPKKNVKMTQGGTA